MNTADLLTDAFARVSETVHGVVDGLSSRELMARVDDESNTIAWLVWHLTRVQDDHIADLMDTDQIWLSAGWVDRFRLALPATDTGYGHSSDDVATVVVESPDLLLGYLDEVHARTAHFLSGLTDADLDRVVDENWTPAVTLGVRLVSIVSDDFQHAGQAAFIRGVVRRR
ncbi:putative damage-inducible protein DinB [Mycetocola sp. CAN_C7]|uniref:mycothiol transferase n=1 Tax=Mycetocola sp. CAN_C7 TaxID=2787724 RepID=UPI0018CB3F12